MQNTIAIVSEPPIIFDRNPGIDDSVAVGFARAGRDPAEPTGTVRLIAFFWLHPRP